MTTIEKIVSAAAAFRATVDEALQELMDALRCSGSDAAAPAPMVPYGGELSEKDRAAALAALAACDHIAVVAARFGMTQAQLQKMRTNRNVRDKARGRRRCLRPGCGKDFVPTNWRAEWYCSDRCRKGQTRDDDGCGE